MNKENGMPVCQKHDLIPQMIEKYKKEMPQEDHLYVLAEFFSVIGDSTRIKILYALFESEMCVCDIAEVLNMTLSAISHQLRILKQARLVKYRRCGKQVLYSLDDDHVKSIINMGNEHINEMYGTQNIEGK